MVKTVIVVCRQKRQFLMVLTSMFYNFFFTIFLINLKIFYLYLLIFYRFKVDNKILYPEICEW